MKQSFAPAIILGLVLVATSARWQVVPGRRRAALDALVAVSPMIVYAVWVTAAGGLGDALDQMLGARGAAGGRLLADLFERLIRPGKFGTPFLVFAALIVVIVIVRTRTSSRSRTIAPDALQFACGAAGLTLGYALWRGGLAIGSDWAVWQFWALVLVTLATTAVDRRVDRIGMTIIAVGWMVSLSWGYPVPALVGGTLALASIVRLVRLSQLPVADVPCEPSGAVPARHRRPPAYAVLTLAALLPLATAAWFVDLRRDSAYRDRPPRSLETSLGVVSDEFGGIVTNPVTAEFMNEIARCVERYPSGRIAVIPSGAASYPAFGRHNPLPIDWLTPLEIVGQEDRILAATSNVLSVPPLAGHVGYAAGLALG